jgi:rRNA maturation endonuclease Nob1
MRKTSIIKHGRDLACGHCYSHIYGYDEYICPVCGSYIDMQNEVKMTQKEFDVLAGIIADSNDKD